MSTEALELELRPRPLPPGDLTRLRERAAAVRRAHDEIIGAYGDFGKLIMATGGMHLRLGDTFHWPPEDDGPIDFWRVVSLLDVAAGKLEAELRMYEGEMVA